MRKHSVEVQEGLIKALLRMAKSPDLTEAEVNRLNQFAMRLVAEFNVLKSEPEPRTSEDTRAA